MEEHFENSIVEQDDAEVSDLPVKKVMRTQEFGGLKFVSKDFYHFVLRLEHVFVLTRTPNILAVLGHNIINRVYEDLVRSVPTRNMVKDILFIEPPVEELHDLVKYLVQTYCCMRGKDYCRQLMRTDFNNLGKCVHSKLAVLSNKDNYAKKSKTEEGKESTAEPNQNDGNDITVLDVRGIHNIMGHLAHLVNDDNDAAKSHLLDADNIGIDESNLLED